MFYYYYYYYYINGEGGDCLFLWTIDGKIKMTIHLMIIVQYFFSILFLFFFFLSCCCISTLIYAQQTPPMSCTLSDDQTILFSLSGEYIIMCVYIFLWNERTKQKQKTSDCIKQYYKPLSQSLSIVQLDAHRQTPKKGIYISILFLRPYNNDGIRHEICPLREKENFFGCCCCCPVVFLYSIYHPRPCLAFRPIELSRSLSFYSDEWPPF